MTGRVNVAAVIGISVALGSFGAAAQQTESRIIKISPELRLTTTSYG